MKKKVFLTAGLLLMGVLAGCGRESSAPQHITVSTFGISAKQMASDVTEPFTKISKVKVKTQSGDSAARYTQVNHNPNSGVDIMELSQNNSLSGYKKNLWEKLDTSKLKNFKYLSADQQKIAKDTNSVPYTVNSVGIVYNPAKVGNITSWDQLWDSKLNKKIAIPDITTTFGPAMLYIAGDHAGTAVNKDNGTAAFKAMSDLKPNVVKTYTQSSDLANMFKSGEIDAAVVGDFAVNMIQSSAPGVKYVVPASGTYANYNTVSILKSSKQKAAAYKYADYRLGKVVQKKAAGAKSLNNAPVNSSVKLSAKEAKNETYGDIAKRAKAIDFDYVNSHLKGWIDQWNKLMNK